MTAPVPTPTPTETLLPYLSSGNEIELFRAAARNHLPILLRGPTGCGKTRFVQTLAAEMKRPLVTVACHEDLTAADLVGRYLLKGDETVWMDGPLTRAVRDGAICYLDEIVEARADTTVVIHPIADHRRELHIERLNETLIAPPEFQLVMSYNPGYQSVLKDLKPSTRQRMITIDLGFPRPDVEERVIVQETRASAELARALVRLGTAIRELKHEGLAEAASTRTLIATALLIKDGVAPKDAGTAAVVYALSDDPALCEGLIGLVQTYLASIGP